MCSYLVPPSFHACRDCARDKLCWTGAAWRVVHQCDGTRHMHQQVRTNSTCTGWACSHARLSVLSAQCKELERILEAHKPMVNKACHGEHMQVDHTCSSTSTTTCPVQNTPYATLPANGASAPALTGGMPSQRGCKEYNTPIWGHVWAMPCYQFVRMASLLTPFSDR